MDDKAEGKKVNIHYESQSEWERRRFLNQDSGKYDYHRYLLKSKKWWQEKVREPLKNKIRRWANGD